MVALSGGDLHTEVLPVDTGDELEVMTQTLDATLESMNRYISDIQQVLTHVAGGDLRTDPQVDYKGDFVLIRASLCTITQSMNETLLGFRAAADRLTAMAEQLSGQSAQLHQASLEQNQSTEELVSEVAHVKERLADVTAITVPEESPNQLVITLRRPNGSLPLLLDIPIALGEGDRPVGTGPYVLAEDGQSLALRAGWWQADKALPVQSILLHTVSKSDELLYAFDGGEVSLVDVDRMATNATGYGGNYQTWDYPTTDFLYLGFNTQKGVFRSADARRAAWLAVDRDTVATTIYANHAISTLLPVHPASGLYQPGEAPLTYDPEGLAAQVEGLRLTGSQLVFLVNSENVAKTSAAQLIAYQLEAAGFSVELKQLPFEEFVAALDWGEFDLYLGETALTAGFDLAPLLGSAGALNYGGWWAEGADWLIWSVRRPRGAGHPRRGLLCPVQRTGPHCADPV